MKRLKDFITEGKKKPVSTGVISGDELMKHIGRTKMKNLQKHPMHQQYVSDGSGAHEHAYKFERNEHGVETIHGANTLKYDSKTTGEKNVRHMVKFDTATHTNKIHNAHLFKNSNDSRHKKEDGGGLKWSWVRSHKKEED